MGKGEENPKRPFKVHIRTTNMKVYAAIQPTEGYTYRARIRGNNCSCVHRVSTECVW